MIHPTAIISDDATIGANCEIGPYCIIEAGVTLGDRCKLHSHVVIHGQSTIGSENEFFPFAAIGTKSQDLKYAGEPTTLEIGDRNVFRENTTVHRGTLKDTLTRIGHDNLFLAYSHVAHDCQLGNHNILSNNGTLGGHVELGNHVIVSGLAGVHQFCRIGSHSIVGGITKIVQDVPPFMIVDGNPAAVRGINLVGLQRRDFSSEEIRALKSAYKKVFLKKEKSLTEIISSISDDLRNAPRVTQLLDFITSSERGIVR